MSKNLRCRWRSSKNCVAELWFLDLKMKKMEEEGRKAWDDDGCQNENDRRRRIGEGRLPTYVPVELCSLVLLQRYTKALSTFQRASLVEKSRQKPQEKMSVLSNTLRINNYAAEPMLQSCGVSISNSFTQIEGRILPTPRYQTLITLNASYPVHKWPFRFL